MTPCLQGGLEGHILRVPLGHLLLTQPPPNGVLVQLLMRCDLMLLHTSVSASVINLMLLLTSVSASVINHSSDEQLCTAAHELQPDASTHISQCQCHLP